MQGTCQNMRKGREVEEYPPPKPNSEPALLAPPAAQQPRVVVLQTLVPDHQPTIAGRSRTPP